MSVHLSRSAPEEPSKIRPDDARLTEAAFPDWRTMCSETFMYKSRDSYPLPWIMREVVQNFVDGNKEAPHTLNGVEINTTQGPDGATTITITGKWPFEHYDDLVSFGSGKLDDEGSSGGNGIGLKQTALRLMRDFDVSRFEIQGEGWKVSYKLVSRDEINEKLTAKGNPHKVKNGALISSVVDSPNRGSCKYVLETADPRVLGEMAQAHSLAVCDANPEFKNVDFQNEHASFKWLKAIPAPIPNKNDKQSHQPTKPALERGHLYVNGQIYRFSDYNTRANEQNDFWGGPDGLTIALNNMQYPMSLDRPPMRPDTIRDRFAEIFKNASEAELTRQLQLSEHLWGNFDPTRFQYANPLYLGLVKHILELLANKYHFNYTKFQNIFAGRKYIAVNTHMNEKEINKLKEDGYQFCPEFFETVGIPTSRTVLAKYENGESVDLKAAKAAKPHTNEVKRKRFELSLKNGIDVPYERFPLHQNPTDLGKYCRARFKNVQKNVEVIEDEKKVKIYFSSQLPAEALVGTSQDNSANETVRSVWSIAHAGISNMSFKDITFCQGEYVTTFDVDGENLVIRNVVANAEPHLEIELNGWAYTAFIAGLNSPEESSKAEGPTVADLPKKLRFAKNPSRIAALVAAAALGIAGLYNVNAIADLADISSISQISFFGSGAKPHKKESPLASAAKNKINDWKKQSTKRTPNSFTGPKKSLQAILKSNDTADVGTSTGELAYEIDDEVEDFEIINNPSTRYLKQLQVLKEYLYLTTGYEATDKLFVYKGKGAYGYHVGNTMGLHEKMMDVSFEEALATFTHETAHDYNQGHGPEFQGMFGALNAQIQDKLADVARKPVQNRTDRENALLATEAEWDQLRKSD